MKYLFDHVCLNGVYYIMKHYVVSILLS